MWRSLVLSLGRPLFSAIVLVAVQRAKARFERSSHMSEEEKVLATQVIDSVLVEINNDINGVKPPVS